MDGRAGFETQSSSSSSSSSNFPLLEQELSPLSQMQGGFTKAMLSKPKVSYITH